MQKRNAGFGQEVRVEFGCGMRNFDPMQGAEEECGMLDKR
jgi:hypothetical protein